jgi:hypothetical protein
MSRAAEAIGSPPLAASVPIAARRFRLATNRGPVDTNPGGDQAGNLRCRADCGAVLYSTNAAPIIELGASRIGFDSFAEILPAAAFEAGRMQMVNVRIARFSI